MRTFPGDFKENVIIFSHSPAAPCISDSEDDDDPDSDPTKWIPKIRDDFFEEFGLFLIDLNKRISAFHAR